MPEIVCPHCGSNMDIAAVYTPDNDISDDGISDETIENVVDEVSDLEEKRMEAEKELELERLRAMERMNKVDAKAAVEISENEAKSAEAVAETVAETVTEIADEAPPTPSVETVVTPVDEAPVEDDAPTSVAEPPSISEPPIPDVPPQKGHWFTRQRRTRR